MSVPPASGSAVPAPAPLATLRDPTPEEASRWFKPRKKSVEVRLKLLADSLATDDTFKLVKRTDTLTELLIETGHGTSLRVSFRADTIDVRLGPFLLQPDAPPFDYFRYIDEVSGIIEVIQLGSATYVYSDDLLGFDPVGTCPGCGMEVFEWQDACEMCEAKVHPPRPGEDEHDGRARRIVDVLLRRAMIELASPRGRRNIERTISAFLGYGAADTEILLGFFMDMADIAEVYCDADELERVFRRIR